MKPQRVIGLDADWMKMAQLQEILITNEARIARLRRKLEEMADLLDSQEEQTDGGSPEPPESGQ